MLTYIDTYQYRHTHICTYTLSVCICAYMLYYMHTQKKNQTDQTLPNIKKLSQM